MKQCRVFGARWAVVVCALCSSISGCSSEPATTPESTAATTAAPAGAAAATDSAEAGRSGASAAPEQPAADGGKSGSAGARAAAAADSGGGGAGASPAAAMAGEATFTAIYKEILTKGATGNCMFAACHGGAPDPAVNGGLQIKAGDQAGAYKNLVNAKSTGMVCTDKTYVIPGDSAGSLLIQKFGDAPPCGGKMPIGPALTPAQIAQVAKWIDDGAKDN